MRKRTSFTVDLRNMISEAKDNAKEVVQIASIELFKKVVYKTPVDTGHLQKNWNISLIYADTTVTDMGNVTDTITSAEKTIKFFKLGDKIWIANDVPYAYDIEYGKSKVKAPQGMVRVSLQEFDMIFKGSAMTVNKGAGSKQNRYLP